MSEKGQIFVGGLPRSGTSLMRIIIGNHPDVAMFFEDLPLWGRFYRNYKNKDFSKEKNRIELIDDINSHFVIEMSKIKPRKEQILNALKNESYVDCMVIFNYLLKDYAEQTSKTRFGIKVPLTEFYAEPIFEAFPNAKIIHVLRDIRDVAVSYRTAGNKKTGEGRGIRQYSLLHHIFLWKNSTLQAKKLEEKYPEKFLIVRYEDVVTSSEEYIQKVCEFTDLTYIPDILEMKEQEAWTGQNSSFQTTEESRSKINTTALGRHKTMLSEPITWVYQLFTWKIMKHFGYTPYQYSSSVALKGCVHIIGNLPEFISIRTMQFVAALIRGSFLYKPTKKLYQKLNIPDYLG